MQERKYTAKDLIEIAKKWNGYCEKKSAGTMEQLKEKTWNCGTKNITYFWEYLYQKGATVDKKGKKVNLQGEPWCEAFIKYLHISLAGLEDARKSLVDFCYDTEESANLYQKMGRWISNTGQPVKGDQVYFKVGDRINYTGLVVKVTEEEITVLAGDSRNDKVEETCYSRESEKIAGYGRPLYGEFCVTSRGQIGSLVKKRQELLLKKGFDLGKWGADGGYGVGTVEAVKQAQKQFGLQETGILNKKTYKALVAMPDKSFELPKDGIYHCTKYDLSEEQKKKIAAMVYQEGGYNQECMDAIASHMCNLYEYQVYIGATKKSLYEYITTTNWYASMTRENKTYNEEAKRAVENCIVSGKRSIPPFVDEFDMYPLDIKDPKPVQEYKMGETKITNIYGASGIFWTATVVDSKKNSLGKKGNVFFYQSEAYRRHCGY